MKKIIAMLLVVVMMASVLGIPAFAATSVTSVLEYQNLANAALADSTAPAVKAEELTAAVAEIAEEEQKLFAEAGIDPAAVKFSVIDQKDISVETDKTAAVRIVGLGMDNVTLAVFLKTADSIKLLGVAKPPLNIEVAESGILIVAIVK